MVDIQVAGDVEGSIVVGDNNFVVNHNHGTIVRQEALSVRRRSLSPQPPAEPEGFVGRKREQKQVEDWISQNKVVVVQGADGIGKTSLIKEVANSQAAKAQPDGVVFVDALDEEGKLLEFGDLIQRLFEALFESKPPEKVDLSSARTYLSNTHPLVLLNSIALTPQNLSQLQNLFAQVPILITTESSLLMRGRPSSLALGPLDREDSLALLTSLTNVEDQEALGQIAALLDNVPAALGIVADTLRTNILSVEEARQRLQSYQPKATDKVKAGLERAFDLLSSTFTEDERGMLDQVVAAFGVSVDRTWLEKEYGGPAVSEKLESLGLLHANSPRLRLMPGLKAILLEGRDYTKQRQHLLEHLLEELKTRWNDFEFIKDELGNLLGLLGWAVATGQWANVAALGRAIDPYLTLSGHWDGWNKTLKQVQSAAHQLNNPALQGWALHQLGTYEFGMGNLSAAQKLLEQAVKTRVQAGDQIGAAYSKHNLQVIAPFAPTVSRAPRPTSLLPWALGGLAVLVIAAFLIFGSRSRNVAAPATIIPTLAASNIPVPALASNTQPATSTLTDTPSPSATITATFTPSPTETATLTPTYATLRTLTINHYPTACHYGPGDVYLDAAGIAFKVGDQMDVFGRAEVNGNSTWLLIDFSPPENPLEFGHCWINSKYLDITPEQVVSVKPIDLTNPKEYKLPIAYDSVTTLENPHVGPVIRNGDVVTVSWEYFDVGAGQYPNHDENFPRYLIEAWLCQGGKIVFSPSGWGPYGPDVTDGVLVSAQLHDEPGCTEPSHARLYLAWAHGYAGPSEIRPWPQNALVPATPTSTP